MAKTKSAETAARMRERAPARWHAAMERADADLRAGRVDVIDLDALCRDIEAEARDMETTQHGEAQ